MDYALTTQGLTKTYAQTKALNGLTMHVPKGAIYGFVGKNGAGKTTLIRLVCGLQAPTAGDYTLYGVPHTAPEIHKARRRMGAVVETPSVYLDLTAADNLKLQYRLLGLPSEEGIPELLHLVGLGDTGKKKARHFSLGMRQRLGIAVALCGDPDFLILDEPINGLDPEGIVEFRELLLRLNRERQTTILISSHILSELSALATHYAFIDRGRMLETISAADLRERCRDCLELRVDDAARAAQVLEEQLGTRDFEVLPQERLRLYAFLDQPQTVNRVLMEQGVGLISAQQKDSNLEDYFLSLIDGHSAGKEGV